LVGDSFIGPRKRRDRLSVIADILGIAREGSLKTHIIYRANLSVAQLNNHLSFLLDANFLDAVGNPKRTIYKTTKKGLRYLQSYKEIIELMIGKENNTEDPNSSWQLKS